MALRLGTERLGTGVEGPEEPLHLDRPHAPSSSRWASDAVFASPAARSTVATPVERRAQRTASACVTGPRQGVPCATATHTAPRRLHSTHTLYVGMRGWRPCTNAPTTSSNCPRSIGQPRSWKSTVTWAAIGVERSSVLMYPGARRPPR